MFHRHFAQIKVTTSPIERAYAKAGVRFKFINRVKKERAFRIDYDRYLFATMN